MNEKETGSFYTPIDLIEYMVAFVKERLTPGNILEPSAGDGRFILPLTSFDASITVVENAPEKATALEENFGDFCTVVYDDFIHYANNSKNLYNLIIGNPPYVSKKKVSEDQCKESEKIISSFHLDKTIFQNLWVSFVLSSINRLAPGGAIFFVLPFEFLQVQYAEKLRTFLETKFNTIEIITFEEKVFNNIEQDVCLVYLTNEDTAKPYIKYTTLHSTQDKQEVFQSVIMRNKPLKKWSNCILDDEETELFLDISNRFPKINSFGNISPGIVTGANSFFILSESKINELNLPENHVLPVITKSSSLKPLLLFKDVDFNQTISDKSHTHLMSLTGYSNEFFSTLLKNYLSDGKNKKIPQRYKCKQRSRWFDVPVIEKGDLCFFKRYSTVPRLIVNQAGVYTTDISYNVRLSEAFNAESFAFCFYNSLTLALCEYSGRFYGGGVGELVPSEFKNLSLPYQEIDSKDILLLDTMIRQKVKLSKIIDYVDSIVLAELSADEISLLQEIRKRYLIRRLKILPH